MRQRSIVAPVILLLIGGLFLYNNLNPGTSIFSLAATYWPFIVIGWGVLRLVEVLVWRDQMRGGFTGGEVVLVVLICVIGSGFWEANRHGFRFTPRGLGMFDEQFDYPISLKAASAGAKRLVFENPRGNIRVTGSDSNEIAVTGHKIVRTHSRQEADRANGLSPIEIVPQGDRILIRTNQDRASSSQRISCDLEVTVPRGVAVEARGTSGDYDISDITGSVELASSRADVRLARIGGSARVDLGRSDVIRALDLKGNLDLTGKGSDVELENVAGQVTINGSYGGTLEFKNLAKPLRFESRNTELRVEALPGRISMDLGEFNGKNLVGPVRLVTRSRDIKIEEFSQSLELETERGDIELQPMKLPLSKIDARSRNGRIELVLPEKSAFQLEATAEHGEAINDFGPAIERVMNGRTATLKGTVGAGPSVRLSTDRGMVAVRKEGTPRSLPMGPPDMPKPPKPPKPPKMPSADTELKL